MSPHCSSEVAPALQPITIYLCALFLSNLNISNLNVQLNSVVD